MRLEMAPTPPLHVQALQTQPPQQPTKQSPQQPGPVYGRRLENFRIGRRVFDYTERREEGAWWMPNKLQATIARY